MGGVRNKLSKDRDESRNLGSRRTSEDDYRLEEDEPVVLVEQPRDSLREGYSWIRLLESRHPGWRLAAVDGLPFRQPERPLSELKVCLVSLAGVYAKGQKPFSTSPGPVPPELRHENFKIRGDWSYREIPKGADSSMLAVAHAHYDHSDADEDVNCVFPLTRLLELELDGFIGECAEMHYSLMGYVPEVRRLQSTVAQSIIPALRKRSVDAVVVSGGCELSHQSAGLIQREIEAAGIPTTAVSVCPDISEQLRVPRAVGLRFPLGNPFGAALDNATQSRILRDCLALLESATLPGIVVRLPYEWVTS
jgi:D-proline reductase (dithiol) PrdB